MIDNDLIIFINNNGDTKSFVREKQVWQTSNPADGVATDEDIQRVRDAGRLFILIRGGFIVATNLTAVRHTARI